MIDLSVPLLMGSMLALVEVLGVHSTFTCIQRQSPVNDTASILDWN